MSKSDFTFEVDKESKNFTEKLGVSERAAVWACEQMEELQKEIPEGNMKDFVEGSCKMIENYVG